MFHPGSVMGIAFAAGAWVGWPGQQHAVYLPLL